MGWPVQIFSVCPSAPLLTALSPVPARTTSASLHQQVTSAPHPHVFHHFSVVLGCVAPQVGTLASMASIAGRGPLSLNQSTGSAIMAVASLPIAGVAQTFPLPRRWARVQSLELSSLPLYSSSSFLSQCALAWGAQFLLAAGEKIPLPP